MRITWPLAALLLIPCAIAQAQPVESFYRGKSINLIIGYPPAGANDVYARMVARHLGRHIPGNPTIVPRNLPGAGSLAGGEPHLQRRAEGWHDARPAGADHSARREA